MQKFILPRKELIVDIIRILYIILWVYAATSKLLDSQKFHDQLAQSTILGPYAHMLVPVVPGLEYFLSILLFFDKPRIIALYCSFGLMVVFSTYIVLITKFSDYTPCSCGGILEKLSWNQHLVLNMLFVILAALAILLSSQRDNISKIFFAQRNRVC
jgi:uncharacterized membrane protein YphA (DoxX/SURF4 family)